MTICAPSGLKPLRPHQALALDSLRQSLRSGFRRPVVQAPTGFGKTVVAAHIVAGARAKGNRVVFCVPTLGLVDQTFERFRENGLSPVEMGVIQADHPWKRPHAPIQIATAQTLARRELPQVDVVVIDEAHVLHSVYARWMADPAWTKKIFIGLTATPWARGMGRRFDALVKTSSLSALIESGFLAPFRVFAPSTPDLSAVRTVAGDWHEGDLASAMDRPTLVADIVETWLLRGEGRPTLCFATGRAHAKSIYERFAEVGVSVAYVDANTPREERDEIGRRLAAGVIRVVVNIGTLTTGIDWDVRCLILARPTKSEILFVQIVGRGLRTAEGKTDCLVLDHSDTHQRLGMVTDIDHDELDSGRARAKSSAKSRERKLPLPKCCPSCAALMPATVRVCGVCGTQMPSPTGVEQVDGALVEMGAGRSEVMTLVAAIREAGRLSVRKQLESVRLTRGRSTGWANWTFKEIFGSWPMPGEIWPEEPSSELLAFVRAKDRAFAKRQAAKTQEAGHATA